MPKGLRNYTHAMVDLHGLSSLGAERAINYWLSTSASKEIGHIRFVTGRGKHLNNKGERGTLYKNFLAWIEKSPYKDRVECCEQHEGFFEVTLKPTQKQHFMIDFFKTTAQQAIASNLETIKTKS
jgi:Smr domain